MATRKTVKKKPPETIRKTVKKTTPAENVFPWTTIRLIEKQSPCTDQYYAFLRDFGGSPVSKSGFPDWINPNLTVRLGPDDPIALKDILALKSTGMRGERRVNWIWEHGCLGNQPHGIYHALCEIEKLHLKMYLYFDSGTLKKFINAVRGN